MKSNFFRKFFTPFLFFVLILTFSISCHKEGTGGKSTVSGLVKHHLDVIPNAIVYLKYGATDFPGIDAGLYDNQVTSDVNAHYEFHNLRKGDYYLFSVGHDNSAGVQVTGGTHIKLKYNKSFSTDIPVTE